MVLCCPFGKVWSFGLGDMTVRSALDHRLTAEINLLSGTAKDIGTFLVRMPAESEFVGVELRKTDIRNDIHFSPVVREDGSVVIEVSSKMPITEQYLRLLIVLEWSNGKILREYRLILDSADFETTPIAKIIAPITPHGKLSELKDSIGFSSKKRNLPVEPGRSYGPVKPAEYLITIGTAIDAPITVSIYQRLYALLRDNPHAFIQNNMNLLRAEVVLEIPFIEEMKAVPRILAMETYTRQAAEWRQYRMRFQTPTDEKIGSKQSDPGMALMKATVIELREEITRLRNLLADAVSQKDKMMPNDTAEMRYRQQVMEDISRLEASKNELVEAISSLSTASVQANKIEEKGESTLVLEMIEIRRAEDPEWNIPVSEGSDGSDPWTLVETVSEMGERLLSLELENEQLKANVFLLEQKTLEDGALLDTKEAALVSARREAAVYGAALESVNSNVVFGEQALEKKSEIADRQKKTVESSASENEDDYKNQPQLLKKDDGSAFNDQISSSINSRSDFYLLLGVVGGVLFLLLLFAGGRNWPRRPALLGGNNRKDRSPLTRSSSKKFEKSDGSSNLGALASEGPLPTDLSMATKLDLARAYIEMGDYVAAMNLLSEVEMSGDTEEKVEAKRLGDHIK